jgi:hypothetical protein
MASTGWLKVGKCDLHSEISGDGRGRGFRLRVWIPASVAKNLVSCLEKAHQTEKEEIIQTENN